MSKFNVKAKKRKKSTDYLEPDVFSKTICSIARN